MEKRQEGLRDSHQAEDIDLKNFAKISNRMEFNRSDVRDTCVINEPGKTGSFKFVLHLLHSGTNGGLITHVELDLAQVFLNGSI